MNDERFIDQYCEVILTIKDVLIKKNMSMYKLSLLPDLITYVPYNDGK